MRESYGVQRLMPEYLFVMSVAEFSPATVTTFNPYLALRVIAQTFNVDYIRECIVPLYAVFEPTYFDTLQFPIHLITPLITRHCCCMYSSNASMIFLKSFKG